MREVVKKISFFLILGLVGFFFFLITKGNTSYTHAQSGGICQIELDKRLLVGVNENQTVYVESGSTICMYNISYTQNQDSWRGGTRGNYADAFTKAKDNDNLLTTGRIGLTRLDDQDKKKYLFCNNGVWEERLISVEGFCRNERPNLIQFLSNKARDPTNPPKITIQNNLLFTPTPLPSSPSGVGCVIKHGSISYLLGVNKKICIQDMIFSCPSDKLSKRILAAQPQEITNQANERGITSFYEATYVDNCNIKPFPNQFCNKEGVEVDIQGQEDLFCTTKENKEIQVVESKVGSFNSVEQDVYGFTCGVPKEADASIHQRAYGENFSRCCNIPRGYNTNEELKKATSNLGCLIDTVLLGSRIRLLCFYEIIPAILDAAGFENIQRSAVQQAQYQTRPCLEGVPLIPVEKKIISTDNNYLSLPSQIHQQVQREPSPRPTIILDGKSYVIAQGEELSLKEDCQCRIIPNSLTAICNKYTYGDSQQKCQNCALKGELYTALGCINLKIQDFIKQKLFQLALGIAGFIALSCIIYSAFQIQISAGNPERVKKAQEILTSCITGLMLIIFSVFILKIIGVDILKIPKLGN